MSPTENDGVIPNETIDLGETGKITLVYRGLSKILMKTNAIHRNDEIPINTFAVKKVQILKNISKNLQFDLESTVVVLNYTPFL